MPLYSGIEVWEGLRRVGSAINPVVCISASERWWHTYIPRDIQRTDSCHPVALGNVKRPTFTWFYGCRHPDSACATDQDPLLSKFLLPPMGLDPGAICMRVWCANYLANQALLRQRVQLTVFSTTYMFAECFCGHCNGCMPPHWV